VVLVNSLSKTVSFSSEGNGIFSCSIISLISSKFLSETISSTSSPDTAFAKPIVTSSSSLDLLTCS